MSEEAAAVARGPRGWHGQAVVFLAVGMAALVVDAGLVQALVSLIGMDPGPARLLSWTAAVGFTFELNRRVTFRDHGMKGTWLGQGCRYLVSQGTGAAANAAVYLLLVHAHPFFAAWPALAVTLGGCVSAVCNFLSAKRLVFRA